MVFFNELGLDINSKDKRLSTPLHWAAFAGSELALTYILALGGNPNAQDCKGLTPIFLAVRSGEDLESA